LDPYDGFAYYKVYCNLGDYLVVTVEVDYPSDDIDLFLYDSLELLEDVSSISGDFDTVNAYPNSITYYYIVVDRYTPSTGFIPFTLTIEGATGIAIPGFEIISLLIAVISVIGVIYLQIKRKKITTF